MLQRYFPITTCLEAIDAGATGFDMQGLFGGKEKENDNASLTAEFYGPPLVSRNPKKPVPPLRPLLGTVTIGPVLAAQRANRTRAVARFLTSRVPRGTRLIKWTLAFSGGDGAYNNGTADDVGFQLTNNPPRDAPDPTFDFLVDGDPSNGETTPPKDAPIIPTIWSQIINAPAEEDDPADE